MLCAERQRADDFDQIDRLASGHERDRIAIYAGNAGFAVVAVECQRKRREILVIQMDGQRNFLLPSGVSSVKLTAVSERSAVRRS